MTNKITDLLEPTVSVVEEGRKKGRKGDRNEERGRGEGEKGEWKRGKKGKKEQERIVKEGFLLLRTKLVAGPCTQFTNIVSGSTHVRNNYLSDLDLTLCQIQAQTGNLSGITLPLSSL